MNLELWTIFFFVLLFLFAAFRPLRIAWALFTRRPVVSKEERSPQPSLPISYKDRDGMAQAT